MLLTLIALSFALAAVQPGRIFAPGSIGQTLTAIAVVALHIGLLGGLAARALGLLGGQPLLVQAGWVLAAGFGLLIAAGGLARLAALPVSLFLVSVHVTMLGLLFIGVVRPEPGGPPAPALPRAVGVLMWGAVALASAVVCAIAIARTSVHFDMEVPTVYAAQVAWLASEPPSLDRQLRYIGLTAAVQADSRMELDGWTYLQAAWARAGGVPAAHLLWEVTTPLLAPLVPLITAATAWVLAAGWQPVQRARLAAFAALAIAIVIAFTIDGLVLVPVETTLSYGAAVVYLHTVRAASTILILPLALFALFAVLARPPGRVAGALIVLFVIGQALAMMRVRQIFVFEVIAGLALLAWWLSAPRARMARTLAVGACMATFALLPLQQYIAPALGGAVYLSETIAVTTEPGALMAAVREAGSLPILEGVAFRYLGVLPVVGETFMLDPASWFYHPVVIVGFALGVLALAVGLLRRDETARTLGLITVGIGALTFVPGMTMLAVRAFGSAAAVNLFAGLAYGLPVAFAFALAGEWLVRAARRRSAAPVLAAAAAAWLLFTTLEPIDWIRASARDQITAVNMAQSTRAITDSDRALLAAFTTHLGQTADARIVANERTSGFLFEHLPRIDIVGWESPPDVRAASARLLDPATPFLDTDDIAFLRQHGISHLVLAADSPLAAQLAADRRFALRFSAAGWHIFSVAYLGAATEADRVFADMNAVYAQSTAPRWAAEGFALPRPGSPAFAPLAALWDALEPTALHRYGAAFAHLLAGDDAAAEPRWEALAAETQAVFPMLAHAGTVRERGDAAGAIALLRAAAARTPEAAAAAAEAALTDRYLFALSPADLDLFAAVCARHPLVWATVAEWDQPTATRTRAALWLAAGRTAEAEAALYAIPAIRQHPRDRAALAVLALLRGDAAAAEAVLAETAAPDRRAVQAYLHADEWPIPNADGTWPFPDPAFETWALLRAERARAAGDTAGAAAAYREAWAAGSSVAAPLLLAEVSEPAEAERLGREAEAAWAALAAAHGVNPPPLPAVRALSTLREGGALVSAAHVPTPHGASAALTFTTSVPALLPRLAELVVLDSRTGETRTASTPVLPLDGVVQVTAVQIANVQTGTVQTGTVDSTGVQAAPAPMPGDGQADGHLFLRPVVLQPRLAHNASIAYTIGVGGSISTVIDPPPPAVMSADARALDAYFSMGDDAQAGRIVLDAAAFRAGPGSLDLRLFWRAEHPVGEPVQAFVHLVHDDGTIMTQADGAPVGGRYPIAAWVPGLLVEDAYTFSFDPVRPPSAVRIGLYRLSTLERLAVTAEAGAALPYTLDSRSIVIALSEETP